MDVVFLHGLESQTDEAGYPLGSKASYLRDRFGAVTPALDTTVARKLAERADQAGCLWRYPFDGYDRAFETPVARAREAIGLNTRLVIGSSFGGAVALRLLHEEPRWVGPVLLLAGAGIKLTPFRSLPAGVRAILVHGRQDDVVPFVDSEVLASTSPSATLVPVDDGHRLSSVVSDELLGAWVYQLLDREG